MDRQIGANLASMPNCPTLSSLLSKDYSHETQNCNNAYIETCPSNHFITRKRSFYILTTMLVLGIIILIFIVIGGTIAYVQHAQQLALRPTIKNKICEKTYCTYGAQCNVDESSQQPYCRCEETCPNIHKPVCGSDGHNYVNECQLKLASCTQQTPIYVKDQMPCGLDPCKSLQCRNHQKCKIDSNGNAKCVCLSSLCPQILKPVCGSDDVSYDSECDLNRESCLQNKVITIKHNGICLPTTNTFKSTQHKSPCYKKICSDDSQCVVRGEQAFCECPQCSEESKAVAVCGNDHKTYANECQLRRQSCLTQSKIQISHNGYCERCDGVKCHYYSMCQLNEQNIAECICPQVCIRVDQPVCGSNGITYENECELKVASCRLQTEITVKFNGSCDLCHRVNCRYGAKCENGKCVCPIDCPTDTFEPICANDGNTYNNDCEMKKTACHNELELIALFYGECEEVEEVDNRIEGSGFGDNKTPSGKPLEVGSGMYMSVGLNPNPKNQFSCENMKCQFGAKCKYNPEGIPYCACQFDCLTQMKQNSTTRVCGKDGHMYESECALREESCKRQIEIHIQDIHMCNEFSLHLMPCNGLQSPLIDTNTGDDMKCDFRDNDCPLNSYCHKTETLTGICCPTLVSDNDSFDCEIDPTFYKCLNRQNTKHTNELEECECNKHGSYSVADMLCNPNTKQCNCKSGVGGLRCDRCEAGFWGLHKISEGNSGCIPCSCNKFGSVRDDCEQMTGRCVCKHGINGMKCDVCPQGSVLHEDGCTDLSLAIPVFASCKVHQCYYGAVCKEQSSNHSLCVCDFNCANNGKHEILSANKQIAVQPVCGSDGSTHMSECHLKLYSCRFQKKVTVIRESSCTDEDLINVKKKKRSLPKFYKRGEPYVKWKSLTDSMKSVSLMTKHETYYFDGNNFIKYFVKPTSISSPFMLSNKITISMWFLSNVLNGICFYYNNSYKIGYTTLYWSITISLVDGFVQMKVDIISIMTRRSKICDEVVTSGQPIKISEWNYIKAEINLDSDSIQIQMNSGPIISRHEVVLQCFGLKPAAFNIGDIKAIGAFYMGGAPVLKGKNFEGAIKKFSINGFEIR